MKEAYTEGVKIWVEHPDECFVSGEIKEIKDDGKVLVVRTTENKDVEVPLDDDESKHPALRNPDVLQGCDDLTALSYLHEPAVLHNVKLRYMRDEIYTFSGIVLIAINPFQQLPIYSRELLVEYVGQSIGTLQPHIFAVADDAYTAMIRDSQDQSIIISGESGAGKTETTKFVMRFLATAAIMRANAHAADQDLDHDAIFGVDAADDSEVGLEDLNIEKQVLATNPILESFGNAKTLRNDNSSRFGKFIELQFSHDHRLVGAKIRSFLLEKSRVVHQMEGERGFHIFYQLCAGATDEEREQWHVGKVGDYAYLSHSSCTTVPRVDDAEEYRLTRRAMAMVGISKEEQDNIFRLLAGVLNMGNIEFEDKGDDSCDVSSPDALEKTASLFGAGGEELGKWLCNKTIKAGSETYTVPLKAQEARDSRDALSKTIYHRIFLWLVSKINQSICHDEETVQMIGVLDIYGFESFEHNSFEQFCINYANEKLQQQFNSHVFKMEQEEYVREEIDWSFIDFADNQECIDLIESKLGVLSLLDEECLMPKGSDASLAEKLYSNHTKHAYFSKPRMSNVAFTIKHYAGPVTYDTEGFIIKNKDQVVDELKAIMKNSPLEFVKGLFTNNSLDAVSARGRKATTGGQFKESLASLMKTIYATAPHYVRCIKPNNNRAAHEFDAKSVTHQLKCGGVLETIRISSAGYPTRRSYADFHYRYKIIIPGPIRYLRADDEEELRAETERGVKAHFSDPDKYQFGLTKVFFRAAQLAFLERLRADRMHQAAILIQKNIRGMQYGRRYRAMLAAARMLQRVVRGMAGRKIARFNRQTRAATNIRRAYLGWRAWKSFTRTRAATVVAQRLARGRAARNLARNMRRENAALLIQTAYRMLRARAEFKRDMRNVVLVQCQFRRRVARRVLSKLRADARSVDGVKQVNFKLERKLMELKQQLDAEVQRRESLEQQLGAQVQGAEASGEKMQQVEGNLQKRIDLLTSENADLKAQVAALTAERDETAARASKAEDRLQRAIGVGDKQMSGNQELEAEKAELAAEVRRLAAENEKLRAGRPVGAAQAVPASAVGGSAGMGAAAGAGGAAAARAAATAAQQAPSTPRSQVRTSSNSADSPIDTVQAPVVEATGRAGQYKQPLKESLGSSGHKSDLTPMPVGQAKDEDKVINVMLARLKPKDVDFRPVAGLVVFRCARGQEKNAPEEQTFLRKFCARLRDMIARHQSDDEMLAYWISSTTLLLHLLRKSPLAEAIPEAITSLNETVVLAIEFVTKIVKQKLLPLIVPAILQSDSNMGLNGRAPMRKGVAGAVSSMFKQSASVTDVVGILHTTLATLQQCCVSPSICHQIIGNVLSFVSTHLFNKLCLRRDLLSWERGMSIKFNLSSIDQFLSNTGLPSTLKTHLRHVREASELLLINNSVINKDGGNIVIEVTPSLNTLQRVQICSIYTPGEHEETIAPHVLEKLKQSNSADKGSLLLDTTKSGVPIVIFNDEDEDEEYGFLEALPVPDKVNVQLQFLFG